MNPISELFQLMMCELFCYAHEGGQGNEGGTNDSLFSQQFRVCVIDAKCLFCFSRTMALMKKMHFFLPKQRTVTLISSACFPRMQGKKKYLSSFCTVFPEKSLEKWSVQFLFFKTKKVNRQKILHIFHSINGQVGMTHR